MKNITALKRLPLLLSLLFFAQTISHAQRPELVTQTGHSSSVYSVAFSPTGKILASGHFDNNITLWDIATGTYLHSLNGFGPVAFSPNGKVLASSGSTKLWDIKSGQELASLISIDETDWLVVTPDGLFDGSPAAWSKIIWRAPQNTFDFVPVEAYFSDFYYPGLLADIFAGKRPQAPTSIEDKDRRQPQVKILSATTPDGSDAKVKGQNAARSYLHVAVEVTEVPADKEHKQGSGAQDVRLFRDGTLVKIWHGDVLGGKDHVKLEANVPALPGENHFTAYAFNHDNIKSSDGTLTAKAEQTDDQAPLVRTAYVLTIGVNRYANENFNLKYAAADARDFGAEWQRQQEALPQFQRVEIVSLTDKDYGSRTRTA